jgi:hypothetical protein
MTTLFEKQNIKCGLGFKPQTNINEKMGKIHFKRVIKKNEK